MGYYQQLDRQRILTTWQQRVVSDCFGLWKVVATTQSSLSLFEKMRLAGIQGLTALGEVDIPAYFGDGKILDMNLGYLIVRFAFGVPYTLDQAYPFVQNALVALGFPDILFQPDDTFKRLLGLAASKADVVLGSPFDQPQKGVWLISMLRVVSVYS